MTNRTQQGKAREALQRALPSARFYDVGGRQLMLYASGTGGPVVVFLPGGGMTGLGYLNLHQQASRFTTSVLYDRAGTGWSDHADLPRSATEVTDELRSLLRVAGVPAPYVFVGHSLGGSYARRFAQRFPADVAGLVFLDPGHEDYTVAGEGPIGGNNKWNWRLRIALYECRHRVGAEHLRELRSFQGVPAWIGRLCALSPTGMVKRPRGIAPGCLACR